MSEHDRDQGTGGTHMMRHLQRATDATPVVSLSRGYTPWKVGLLARCDRIDPDVKRAMILSTMQPKLDYFSKQANRAGMTETQKAKAAADREALAKATATRIEDNPWLAKQLEDIHALYIGVNEFGQPETNREMATRYNIWHYMLSSIKGT